MRLSGRRQKRVIPEAAYLRTVCRLLEYHSADGIFVDKYSQRQLHSCGTTTVVCKLESVTFQHKPAPSRSARTQLPADTFGSGVIGNANPT
jgi:hypothetical protein